ncbi:TPA: nucleotide-binding domain containing protein, partial [Klebsiella pneumoniae]
AHALGATGFQIRGRVAECVPNGHFLGGRWSRPVMTKAGGFGTDTTLLHVVNFIEEKLSV